LVIEQLKPKYTNVWLVGGSILAGDFIRLKLADELRISIIPIVLGSGTVLFEKLDQEKVMHLKEVIAYKNEIVALYYEVRK